MSFTSYLVKPFDYSHENIFFREFSNKLEKSLESNKGRSVLVGNLSVNGHQLDAVFISSGKIIVIDFKDYEGTLKFSEQNPWKLTTSNGELIYVAGGARQRNPYQQLQAYRFSLIDFLKNNNDDLVGDSVTRPKWYYTSSLVFFQRPIKFNSSQIPGKISRYFFVTDEKNGIDKIKDIQSNGLNLTDNQINLILRALDIRDENILSNFDFKQEKFGDGKDISRISLVNRLLENTKGTDSERVIEYYRTIINLEKHKEPKTLNVHKFRIDEKQALTNYRLDISKSDHFYSSFVKNKQERFPKDLFIGIDLTLEGMSKTLFQTVIPSSEFSQSVYDIDINDFEIFDQSFQDINLTEDVIEELKTGVNSVETFEEKVNLLEEVLDTKISPSDTFSVGLCETGFYSAQLLSELKGLKGKISESELTRQFILKEPISKNEENILKYFTPITKLNTSQEEAVKKSFKRNLSVVTGPPGTGKSQLVQNIISNAIMNDLSCLFVSKNNRAVDNVVERIGEVLTEPYLLRFGSKKEIQEKTIPKLKEFVNNKNKGNFENKERELNLVLDGIQKINRRIDFLEEEIKRIPSLNHEISQLSRKITTLKEELKLWKDGLDSHLRTFFIDQHLKISLPKIQAKKLFDQAKRVNSSGLYKFFFNLFWKKSFFIELEKLNDKQSNAISEHIESIAPYIQVGKDEIKVALKNVSYLFELEKLSKDVKAKNNEFHAELKPLSEDLSKKGSELKKLEKDKIKYLEEIKGLKDKLIEAGVTALNLKINQNLRNQTTTAVQGFADQLPINVYRTNDLIKLKNNYTEFLKDYKITCLTNLSVKNSVPLQNEVYDLLVIDEASQCDIASAIPLIYRAKRVVIIGDPLQLKHITSVQKAEEELLLNKLSLKTKGLSYCKDSLYDYAYKMANLSGIETDFLAFHYRCHPEIINFSNEHFYQKHLGQTMEVATTPDQFGKDSGMFWIDVKGDMARNRNINLAEVDCIVDLVKKLRIKEPNSSIGIVTPFKHQYQEIFKKIDYETKQVVKVDTVHKFQGDEKDIMIFSLVITPSATKGKSWFVNANYHLLNVGITRARGKLYIVGDNQYCSSLVEKNEKTPLALLANYTKDINKLILN